VVAELEEFLDPDAGRAEDLDGGPELAARPYPGRRRQALCACSGMLAWIRQNTGP
jgi:hypothetical protein